jgi:2-dehydropantoate 2-reductase
MLLDVENGRPCELEVLIGSLLDRARARGVATPRLDLVYASLKVHQDMVVRQYSQSESHKEHIADWLRRRPAVAGAGLEGRKAWEKAMKASAQAGEERVKVAMARGKPKVGGKGVNMQEAEEEEARNLERFD